MSEIWPKRSNIASFTSPVVGEERTRQVSDFLGLGSVALLVDWVRDGTSGSITVRLAG